MRMKKLLLFSMMYMLALLGNASEITFDMTDPIAFGFSKAANGSYTQIKNGETLTKDNVVITAAFSTGNGLRFFTHSTLGTVNLRAYVNSTFTFSTTDNSKITKIEIEGTNLGTTYLTFPEGYDGEGTWIGDATSVEVKCIKSTVQLNSIKVTVAESGSLAAPNFSPSAGNYYGSQTIKLTGPTGAKIFYSLDGREYNEYTAPFLLEEPERDSKLYEVYAYSELNEQKSDTVTARYVISAVKIYNTLADLSAACTATSQDEAPIVRLMFTNNDMIVTYSSGQNTFISDGHNGFLIYGSGATFSPGTKLSGYIEGKLYSYNGLKELSVVGGWDNVEVLDQTVYDVTSQEKTITEIVTNIDALESSLVQINSVNFEAAALTSKAVTVMDEDGEELVLYDQFGVLAAKPFNTTDKYIIIGFPARRNSSVQMYVTEIRTIHSEVASPSFNISTGTYEESQTVTMSSTNATSIYYTLDGTDPSSKSTKYERPIIIDETTTIKAIAYNNAGIASSISEITITIDKPIRTIRDLYAACTATTAADAPTVKFKFENLLVTGSKNSNVYVSDGENAFLIYGSKSGLEKGDIISGTITGKLYSYSGLSELAVSDSYADVVKVSSGNNVSAVTKTLKEIADNYKAFESQYVEIKEVTFAATAVSSKNVTISDATGSVVLRDNFNILTSEQFDTNATYTVKGFVLNYNGTAQLYPIAVEDIVKNIPDAIHGIKAISSAKKGIYTIQGQKIETIAGKGVYIIDGKKIYIK